MLGSLLLSLIFTVTAYCPCEKCCGKWSDGYTATGQKAKWGIVAVDPKVIPLHSKLKIGGLGVFKAEDTGGAIKGRHIDILFPTHQEALEFGVKKLEVEVLNGD